MYRDGEEYGNSNIFEFLTEMFSYSLCCIPIIHNGMKMIGRLNSKYAQRLEDLKLCHLINSINFSMLFDV